MEKILNYTTGKTHVVFDWNGTLINDVDLTLNVINHIFVANGLEATSKQSYLDKNYFPVINYYRDMGFDFNKRSFEKVSEDFERIYYDQVRSVCKLFSNTEKVLKSLKDEGKKLVVLSAAYEQSIIELLQFFKIHHYFDAIYGSSDAYASGKKQRALDMIREMKMDPTTTLFVGDTDHDFEVAEHTGMEVILFGDGHQSRERLNKLCKKVLMRDINDN